MSRIGKRPIEIPAGVEVSLQGSTITVKGKLGTLSRVLPDQVRVELEGSVLTVYPTGETRQHRAMHGLMRTLINNMVVGVSTGYTKELELIGVGYRAQFQNKLLTLSLGYSHPVEIPIPDGLDVNVEANTKLAITGADKQALGDLAAYIRSKRPPEPYKGKGIRYKNEVIVKKAGKSGKK